MKLPSLTGGQRTAILGLEERLGMRLEVIDTERCVGCQSCIFACSRRLGIAGMSASCIHIRSAGGMERGFVVIACRACEDPPCARVCPTDALGKRKGGGVRLKAEKCIGCGNCRDACLVGAVFWDGETNKPMICIHCGFCVPYCPHGVIGMRQDEKTGVRKEAKEVGEC